MSSTSDSSDQDLVRLSVARDRVALLTLDNPPLNLTRLGTVRKLIGLCAELRADPAVRVLVVTGAGDRAFCAGSDITEFADVRDDVVSRKLADENAAFTALEELPFPVIAALNGVTLGGGAEIALACDLRVIDERAVIGFPEVALGVFPGSGGVFRLPRVVGSGHAYELLYTGAPVDAQRAHAIGLANRVAPAGQALDVAVELARELAGRPALALSQIRSGVRAAHSEDTAEATARTLAGSHRVFTGPDIDEGISAFFDKRAPQFTAPRPTEGANPGGTP